MMPRGDGVTQRWYLALSGSSSVRWEPLKWPRAERQSGVNNYAYLYMCAFTAPAAVEGAAERSLDGLGRVGLARGRLGRK